MTEGELERIKSAYHSGLKVQVWSNGYWYDFDAREYPNGGFSVMRQYRIVGSEYAEKAEAEIKRLENQIEKLKKCDNCKNNTIMNPYCIDCENHNKWEFAE